MATQNPRMAVFGIAGVIVTWVFSSSLLMIVAYQKGTVDPAVWVIEKTYPLVVILVVLEFGLDLDGLVSGFNDLISVIL